MDVTKNVYEVFVLRSDKKKFDLTQIVTDLSWEEGENDMVTKANIGLANKYHSLTNSWTGDIVPPGSFVYIFANGEEVFWGTVWEFSYSASNDNVSITVCDRMIYLSQSSDSAYYAEGQSTNAIVSNICQRWSIPLNYSYYNHSHGKLVMRNRGLIDQLSEVLDECYEKENCPVNYVAQFIRDTLYIRKQGYNEKIYVFSSGDSASASLTDLQMDISLSNLVTRVRVMGNADEDGKEPIEDTIDGDTSFGILQEQVYYNSDETIEDARNEARTIIKDRGKPERSFSIEVPDIPTLRKGYKVRCILSKQIDGYYYVTSITHNATNNTMSLSLQAVDDK